MNKPPDNLIAKLHDKLDHLPEKPRNSKRALVDQLRPTIEQARQRGYSYEEISNLLAEEGFEIKARTLKTYCGASGRKKAKAQSNGAMPYALPRTT
jgi:DNA-directed RNA polymerase specialized sigma54-like protein